VRASLATFAGYTSDPDRLKTYDPLLQLASIQKPDLVLGLPKVLVSMQQQAVASLQP
jgi:hypothetical protein